MTGLRYVYAVCRPFGAALQAQLTGVAGDPPRLLPHGDLIAVVSHVPEADFGEEALRARLGGPGLADRHRPRPPAGGRRPHRRHHPAAARLATVFRDDSGVRVMMEEREAAFRRTLDRLDGRVEWGVKVYVEVEPARRPQASAPPAPKPATGRDYLRQRHRARPGRTTTRGAGPRSSPPGCTRGSPSGPTTRGFTRRRTPPFPVPPDGTFSMPPIWWPATHRRNSSKQWTARRTTPPESGWNSPDPGRPIPSPGRQRGGIVTVVERREVALVDLLDRLLAGGVVITGDITLRIADVDLVRIDLNALISSVNATFPHRSGTDVTNFPNPASATSTSNPTRSSAT